jgi:Haem-degrading
LIITAIIFVGLAVTAQAQKPEPTSPGPVDPVPISQSTGSASAQTSPLPTLNLDDARAVLHAAEQKARELAAPSSIAVVDPAGDLILFEQMQGARPIGIGLAIGKARSAVRYRASTQTL